MIKNNDKDRILEAVDHDGLDKLISDTGLALSKKGMRYYARCPFHDDNRECQAPTCRILLFRLPPWR